MYLLGFGGSLGALLVPALSCAPSALSFSICGDFEPAKAGLGTEKFGLESTAFTDLSPLITVD